MAGTDVVLGARRGGGMVEKNKGERASFIVDDEKKNSPVGVEAILDELLNDAHRTLYHLPGGYPIDHLLG